MPGNGKRDSSIQLMGARLRHREMIEGWRDRHEVVDEEAKISLGVADQLRRLKANGGSFQQDRMIFDKRRSLDDALYHSYQGADIVKVGTEQSVRALINANKLKQDYDDKILSVHKEDNFHPGDVFEWLNTGTYWLIYLQDLTELAYFRGDIRKCSYQINWEDEDGKHSSYVAVRGPVETKIDYIQKHTTSVDIPNHSLNILMPKNEETIKYFQRYSKFYLQGEEVQPSNICWRVEAIDWISMPGVLEVNATEYYSNLTEDNLEEGIAGGLIEKIPEPPASEIEGESFIKPKMEYIYKYSGATGLDAPWTVNDKKLPVKLLVGKSGAVKVQWISSYSGQFVLSCGEASKTIVVESLF